MSFQYLIYHNKSANNNKPCYNHNMGFNEIELEDDVKIETDEIQKFKLVMFNDNFTSIDFVLMVLVKVLKKTDEEAIKIVNNVHKSEKGKGTVVYESTLSITQIKKKQIDKLSEQYEFPLRVEVEE